MKTPNYSHLFRAIVLICLLYSSNLLALESNNTHKESDYLELCRIYKSIVNEPIDVTSKEMKLTEVIEKNLPKLFNDLYIHVLNTDADSRYEFIQKFAILRDKLTWECEYANKYYSTQF